MTFCTTLRGQRYSFPDLRDLMTKANEEKSGDALAGITAGWLLRCMPVVLAMMRRGISGPAIKE
jgi:ethanolamine ammonia-lyase large subunit